MRYIVKKGKPKKRRKKRGVAAAKNIIRIHPEKRDLIADTLINHPFNITYFDFQDIVGVHWQRLKALTEEFQLYELNTWYRTQNKYASKNFAYHFPTLAQFTREQIDDILDHGVIFRGRSTKVKLNQLVRFFTFYAGEPNGDVAKKLGVSYVFVSDFKNTLITLMKTSTNRSLVRFGIACGLHQLTEPRGIVQTLSLCYNLIVQPKTAKKLAEEMELYAIEGFIHPESVLADVETIKFCAQQIRYLLTDDTISSTKKKIELDSYQTIANKIRQKYGQFPLELVTMARSNRN